MNLAPFRHIVSLALWALSAQRAQATAPDAASAVVSYQYLDTLVDAPMEPNVISPLVSYLYLDWPGDENLTFQTSPTVSYFFSGGVSLAISGTVRTPAGAPIAGALVTLQRYGTAFWTGSSDVNGAFTVPNLQAANYTVAALKDGFNTYLETYQGEAGGSAQLDIRLTPRAAVPAVVAINRTPDPSAVRPGPDTSDPAYPMLAQFDGERFVYDTDGLDPAAMTVVIAHGWQPLLAGSYAGGLDWAKNLAQLIHANHATLGRSPLRLPNVVVWDWRERAHTLGPQSDEAALQGVALGHALLDALGSDYGQPVHFIGHSLGTIVNRYACDTAHGSLTGYLSRDNPSVGWRVALTKPHVTLLDEAEVASIFEQQVITSAALGGAIAGTTGALVAGAAEAKRDWKHPVPKDALWVDNYISLVGMQREDAVNIVLPKAARDAANPLRPISAVEDAHAYAHFWYRWTLGEAGVGLPVGYGVSNDRAVFPPTGTGAQRGVLWWENLATPDPLDVFLDPNPQPFAATAALANTVALTAVQLGAVANLGVVAGQTLVYEPLDATVRGILGGYQMGLVWAGGVGGTAIYTTGRVVAATSEKIGLGWDAAADWVTDVSNSLNPDNQLRSYMVGPSFMMLLGAPSSPSAAAMGTGTKLPMVKARSAAGTGTLSTQPPQAWVTVAVPPDAGLMAFDFTVRGDPVNDRIACAINEQNVFTLPAKFAPEGEPMSTDLLDVSAYAGQTVEIYFGLVGGTATACEVAIDGLRFITIPQPKVGVAMHGPNLMVKWPAAASGWVLETSDTLAPDSWQAVPLTGMTAEQGVLTVEQPMDGPRRFYRLRRVGAE